MGLPSGINHYELLKSCGIFDGMFDATSIAYEDQTTPQSQELDEFDHWFEELLEVSWDEYLAFDNQLESEAPMCAPTAIEHLNQMQKLFVDNDVIFTQINSLYSAVTSTKISDEITKKSKQSSISDFFNPCQNE